MENCRTSKEVKPVRVRQSFCKNIFRLPQLITAYQKLWRCFIESLELSAFV